MCKRLQTLTRIYYLMVIVGNLHPYSPHWRSTSDTFFVTKSLLVKALNYATKSPPSYMFNLHQGKPHQKPSSWSLDTTMQLGPNRQGFPTLKIECLIITPHQASGSTSFPLISSRLQGIKAPSVKVWLIIGKEVTSCNSLHDPMIKQACTRIILS